MRAEFYINNGTMTVVKMLEDETQLDVYHGEINEQYIEQEKQKLETNGFEVEIYKEV